VDIGGGKLIRIAVWSSQEERVSHADRSETLQYHAQYMPRMKNAIITQGEVVSNSLIKASKEVMP
jgi:hypothetical protein